MNEAFIIDKYGVWGEKCRIVGIFQICLFWNFKLLAVNVLIEKILGRISASVYVLKTPLEGLVYGIAIKVTAYDTNIGIPFGHQFLSRLFHFITNS